MRLYLIIIFTLTIILLIILLMEIIKTTAGFLKEKLKESQAREYKDFREAVDLYETPIKLELFVLENPNSIYCEHAYFEIAEKYMKKKKYKMAKKAYEDFIKMYPKSIHVEIARDKLKETGNTGKEGK